jgi:hypothetical protein
MNIPYLSIVIVGRNDNYGENFLLRINTFIRSLDFNLKNYPDLVELIVVEWNPIEGYEPLRQVLHKPKNMSFRIITVPNRIHELIGASSPVLEFHGKNVGIRRASGKFILVTNPDIIFSNSLINELMGFELREDTYYRTDRCDYNGIGIENVEDKDYVKFALKKTFVVHLNHNHSTSIRYVNLIDDISKLPKSDVTPEFVHTNASGDFILASRSAFDESHGLWETIEQKWGVDGYSLYRMKGLGLQQVVFTAPNCIFHMDHKRNSPDVPWNQKKANEMLKTPFIFDTPRQKYWGLTDIDLPEWKHL